MDIWVWVLAALLLGLTPIIYNVFLHPLRHFPGPRMAGATSWWRAYKEVFQQVTMAQLLFDLHQEYGKMMKLRRRSIGLMHSIGEIVRIAPNEVCLSPETTSSLVTNVCSSISASLLHSMIYTMPPKGGTRTKVCIEHPVFSRDPSFSSSTTRRRNGGRHFNQCFLREQFRTSRVSSGAM